jgi:NAD(P)-dependent dehydrogenase (short-subunit alcohol dehydrogenase family)
VSRALVFGGTGALGSAIVACLRDESWSVDVAGRAAADGVAVDLSAGDWPERAAAAGRYDAVVWAQGLNASGGLLEATAEDMRSLYEANVVFITDTLKKLVLASALAVPSRGVVVSSVWQLTARANKLAYVASKAALAGLVPALAIDLASHGFSINGVLPGVVDTPMTRTQLTGQQIVGIEAETIGGTLVSAADVARAVAWLVDARAAGINAQWIAVDNGWSAVRSV